MESQGAVPIRKPKASQNSLESNKFLGFFSLLALFAVIGISLGLISLKKGISSPFSPKDSGAITNSSLAAGLSNDDTAALRNLDTDEDGLTDYDELYLYNTSPYLSDSDSDTFSDKQEIDKGDDPNCPVGQDCLGTASLLGNTNASTSSNTNSASTAANTNAPTGLPTTATGEVDIAKLREILKNAGAPAYVVDATDDQTLLDLYQSTLSEVGAPTDQLTNANETPATLTDQQSLAALKELTPAEIRSILQESGANLTLLSQVSDEDLQTIFYNAVDEELKETQP